MYTWTYDINDNVLKNHALSNDLYENALQNSVAMPYVEVQSEFGRNKGESLTFTRFDHIAEVDDAEVAETDPLPEVAFSISTSQFVIKEYGVAVPYTEKIEALAHFNVENLVQRTLMEQKRLVLDTLALKSFLLTNVKYVPTGAATKSVTYNGTPSGTAQEALTYFHVEDISALMFDTLNVPYWEGDVYMGIFRAKTLTTLRRDSQFTAWNQYGNAGVKAKGEVGIIERLKLLETNHAKPLPYVGSNNFGQGIVFGKDAVGMIEALAPELRAALPSGHGRFKSIAWFGRLGFNIIFSGLTTQAASIGKARVIHVTSA